MSQIERPPNANRSPGEDWLTAELSRWFPPFGPTLPLPNDAIGIPPKLPLKGEGQGCVASTFPGDSRRKFRPMSGTGLTGAPYGQTAMCPTVAANRAERVGQSGPPLEVYLRDRLLDYLTLGLLADLKIGKIRLVLLQLLLLGVLELLDLGLHFFDRGFLLVELLQIAL